MPRLTVQVSDEVFKKVKALGIPVSLTCQRALIDAVAVREAPTDAQGTISELLVFIGTSRERLNRLEDVLTNGASNDLFAR